MRSLARVAAAVMLIAVAARPAGAQTPARILVMPFENVTRESRIFWLGEASAVLLADDLNALGVGAITREERRMAFERLQVPPAASLTDATVIRIGQLVGASHVVVGSLRLQGDSLVVNMRSIALEAGRLQHNVTEGGPMPDLFGIFERIARRIAQPPVGGSQEVPLDHPPIAVFENYIKGLLAETPTTAVAYLNAALQLQPSFARARLALWDVYDEQGDHERALAAVARVAADSPWSRRARFLAGLSQLSLNKNDDAYATYKALADERPTASVLNNLGVVQLRRGGTPQAGQPSYFFTKAADTDPTDPDYFFNLGYAYWMARDPQAAIYWLREGVRRNPADGEAHFVLSAALSSTGNTAEATRERELARRLSSTFEDLEKRPATDPVPRGLERVKGDVEVPTLTRIDRTLAGSEQRDQQELARFYLDRGRRLYEQELDREALAELNRALFLSPYQAEVHLMVGRIHLRGGRIQEAIDAFKISLWSAETAEAHVALARAYLEAKDSAAARTEAARALELDPSSADAKATLDRASTP
jgi:tetratricopeptide (TPR) repeat protein/TolB-like protein